MNQLTLPTARATDPITSHRAASSVAPHVKEAVLRVHCEHDGLTDDDLVDLLPRFWGPTVRSARSRLKKDGRLRDSGRTRPSNRGRQAIVWEVTA